MKRVLLSLMVLFASMATTPIAADLQDGPFGLMMGMSKQDIEQRGTRLQEIPQRHHLYMTSKVPRGFDRVESYVMQILPESGLCHIMALGKTVETSSHGVELQRAFATIADLLEESYGKYKLESFLRPGSIWDEPEDWMMGLAKNERVLQAKWDASSGSKMRNSILRIVLTATARGRNTGYVSFGYVFENMEQCSSEEKGLAKGIL